MTLAVALASALAVGWLTRPGVLGALTSEARLDSVGDLDADRLLELLALLRLGMAAGLSLRAALELADEAVPAANFLGAGPAREIDVGPADLLASISLRCPGFAGFDSVVLSARYGLPIDPALERVEAELGAALRRRREIRVRRLPVQLLFPLVVCVLPAFALVGVVPVVIAALQF
ncbi:MAG: hypothetical protein P8N02_13785 [Actinomycetota bacterium]|jgi:tight adherence protein C|nr:hypothetical protein [Actinomycetota bacterium]